MELVAFVLPSLPGILLAYRAKTENSRSWFILLTVWLGVPLGLLSSIFLGFWISDANQCVVNGRLAEYCDFLGFDVTDWVAGLTSGGYAMAFVGVPWFVIGLVLLGLIRFVQVLRENS